MSVERNRDGCITVKTKTGVTSISKTISQSEYNHEEFQKWVEHCANLVSPCAHTFKETEQYFLKLCDTQPIDKNDRRLKNFQINVIMNHYKYKLEHPAADFSFDMTDEEIEKWRKDSEDMRNEAQNSPPERFGLIVRGYYLPCAERNIAFYEDNCKVLLESFKHRKRNHNQIEVKDICFFFEETTETYQCNGDSGNLMQKLILFRGVTANDIEKHSLRFLSYISVLRDMGNLPSLTEF